MSLDSSEDEEITYLKKQSSKECEVIRTMIGSYSFVGEDHHIYIPGFPSILKSNWKTINFPKNLKGDNVTTQDIHINEYAHHIYFEPMEEVLKKDHLSIFEFDIVSDRNNIRKLDDALNQGDRYIDFSILCKLKGNTLFLKREEELREITDIGAVFERYLSTKHEYSRGFHTIIKMEVISSDQTISLLLRGEVDSIKNGVDVVEPSEYEDFYTTESGLEVHSLDNKYELKDLYEIKMAFELKNDILFQSWLLGINQIAHGTRTPHNLTKIEDLEGHKEHLNKVIGKLLEYKQEMEEGQVHRISREHGGKLKFELWNDRRKWFSIDEILD